MVRTATERERERQEQDDARAARICWLMSWGWKKQSGGKFTPDDFMPQPTGASEPMTEDQMREMIKLANATINGGGYNG